MTIFVYLLSIPHRVIRILYLAPLANSRGREIRHRRQIIGMSLGAAPSC